MIDHAIVLAEEELTGQNSDITEAEHSEFAQADWEPWAGGPGEFGYKNTDPRGFHSTFCEVIATKTGAHGWWHVSALGEDDVIACAYLETAAECIQWAADPSAFESNDWPNDTVTTVEP